MPQSPPSTVPNPTTPTHWLHKSGVQTLSDFNAANPPTPDSNGLKPASINLHLYIKYRPSIYAVQNDDGIITVPWFWINPIQNPRIGQRPLSELILEHLIPSIRTASITAPQFLEFRFEEPLVECMDVFEEAEKGGEGKGDGNEGGGEEASGQKRKRDELGEDGPRDGDGSQASDDDEDESDESDGDENGEISDESSGDSEEHDRDDEPEQGEDDRNSEGEEDENERVGEISTNETVQKKPVAKVLLMAVIMGVSAANRDWVMPGWQKRAWFRDTNPWVLQQLMGGQVVERLKQMGSERALNTLTNRNLVRIEILRSLGHLIRISETAQNITHPCVAILEPVSILEEARENTGLMLLNLSPDRMDIIKNSQKIVHANGRVPACIWAVVGWFDRRHPGNGEALLMESEWSMKRFFLENGRNKSAWLQFWHGDPQEFLVESEKLLPEVFRWGLREIMPI